MEPPYIKDWSVWRNFHEAGLLMTTRFRLLVPYVVTLLFPASLISVVCVQFLFGPVYTVLDKHSSDILFPRWALCAGALLYLVFGIVPINLVLYASNKILHVMRTMYAVGTAKNQMLMDLLRSGRGSADGQLAVAFLCLAVHFLTLVPPWGFGFKGVAAVGMPEWTAVLFTPLLAMGMNLLDLYLLLVVNLLAGLWVYAAQLRSAQL